METGKKVIDAEDSSTESSQDNPFLFIENEEFLEEDGSEKRILLQDHLQDEPQLLAYFNSVRDVQLVTNFKPTKKYLLRYTLNHVQQCMEGYAYQWKRLKKEMREEGVNVSDFELLRQLAYQHQHVTCYRDAAIACTCKKSGTICCCKLKNFVGWLSILK